MNEFKVNDEVWFFYTNYGRHRWGEEDTIIYPNKVELFHGKIVFINEDKDSIHIYIDNIRYVLDLGFCFFNDYVFRSKNEAIESMRKQLDDLQG